MSEPAFRFDVTARDGKGTIIIDDATGWAPEEGVPLSPDSLVLPKSVPMIGLADAIRTVTKTPAEAVGLSDRGEIAVGKRADLIRVHVAGEVPAVRSVWRDGRRVA